MSSKSAKSAIGIFSIIFLILLASIVFGLYDVSMKNKEASRLLSEAKLATERGEIVQSLKILRGDIAEDINTFDSLVFTADKLVSLIETIEDTGRRFGLETDIVSVDSVEGGVSEPDTISIVVEARGPWEEVFSFLITLESLPHYIVVREVRLSEDGGNWFLKTAFSLYAFN